VLSGNLPDEAVRYYIQDKDSLGNKEFEFTIEEVLSFANFIHNNDLWRDMIVQVYINKKHEFELIPRVGDHVIILGKLDNYKYKMEKLEALYKKALPKYGWKYYEKINLKYSNQVVCSK
jgi:cell division protein FtsQ